MGGLKIGRILILNNRSETLRELLEAFEKAGAQVEVKNPLENFQPEAYEGVVISGGVIPGSQRKKYLDWYCRLLSTVEVPLLAICLGLRILGYCNGSRMRRLHPAELGITRIFFHREYPLALGRRELLVYENHDFELLNLKEPFENYGSSERCRIQAVKHRDKPLFAVQFHPEVTKDNEGFLVIQSFVNLCKGRL
ncbi:hypothetical protein DRO53_05165 [Candidatus Bathyarchaeota archaeon]|nr:MAG: hypothetical protein DRO53_05165 [Candidatus Bathyarchaeota archaeon]